MKEKTINFIIRTAKSIIAHDYSGMAAEMSYMLIIGIFPFMLFLVSLFNLIGKDYFMNPLFLFMQQVMPEDSHRLIRSVLDQVVGYQNSKTVAIFALFITLFLSMNALSVIIKGLNRAYKVEETRAFLYTRFLSLMMVIVNTMVLFLSVNIIIFGRLITRFLEAFMHIAPNVAEYLLMIRWPVAFVALFIMAFLQYYVFPNVKWPERFKLKSALPGTIFFCVVWLVASWGFSLYVNSLHTYNFVYGTIAAFAMLMVWLYFTSMLVLIGGEINYQMHEKLEREELVEIISEN